MNNITIVIPEGVEYLSAIDLLDNEIQKQINSDAKDSYYKNNEEDWHL